MTADRGTALPTQAAARPRAAPLGGASAIFVLAIFAAATIGCGIKGPPKPPLAPGARGATTATFYRVEKPRRDGQAFVLVWRAATAPAGFLALERHVPHVGDEGPACGLRTIVARVRAAPELTLKLPDRERDSTYRWLDAKGAPVSEAITLPR